MNKRILVHIKGTNIYTSAPANKIPKNCEIAKKHLSDEDFIKDFSNQLKTLLIKK